MLSCFLRLAIVISLLNLSMGVGESSDCVSMFNYDAPRVGSDLLDPCNDGPCWSPCDHEKWHETAYSKESLQDDQYECLSAACLNFFYGHVSIQVLEECAHYKCSVPLPVIAVARPCAAKLLRGSSIYAALEDYKIKIDRYMHGNRSLVEFGKSKFMGRVKAITEEQYTSNNKLELTVHDMNTLLEETDTVHEERQVDVILLGLEESISDSIEINEHIQIASSITEYIRQNLHRVRGHVNTVNLLTSMLKVVKMYLDRVRLEILNQYVRRDGQCDSVSSLVVDLEDVCDVCVNGECKFDENDVTVECVCSVGWLGEYCDIPIRSCEATPCLHDGGCWEEGDDFRCECKSAWVGRFCEIPVNERDQCSSGPSHPCQHGSKCTNITGDLPSYMCACDFGWDGRNCQYASRECDHPDSCKNNGQCHFNGTRLECQCPKEPIYNQPFFTGSTCSLRQGDCNYDHDAFDNGVMANGHPCSGHGWCQLDPETSGWTCMCEPTHVGIRCSLPYSEADKCVLFGIPCVNGDCQTCSSKKDCQCTCDPGYEGADCSKDVDPCAKNPCINGGVCLRDSPTDYYCDCSGIVVSGHRSYGGRHCEKQVSCWDRPCGNHFRSCNDQLTNSSVQCICESPYVGNRCEKNIAVCDETSCLNGGNCIQGMVGFCHCNHGYSGDRCQFTPTFCKDNPCGTYGTCRLSGDSFVCQCNPGWTDSKCNVNVNDCDPDPCQNGGTCVDKLNDFTCLCSDEYRGTYCEMKKTPCDDIECSNHGTCVDTSDEDWTLNNYECKCPSTICRTSAIILGSGNNAIKIETGASPNDQFPYWLLFLGLFLCLLFAFFVWYKFKVGSRTPRRKFIMMAA